MREGCRALTQAVDAPSGFYWVIFGTARHEVYCDMTTDGVSSCTPTKGVTPCHLQARLTAAGHASRF